MFPPGPIFMNPNYRILEVQFHFWYILGTSWTQPTAEEGFTLESVSIQADCMKDVNAIFEDPIFYFFSRHELIGQHTEFQTSQNPLSCFLQITSQILNKYNRSNQKINHTLLAVLHHLKKKWICFDEKSAQNHHLLSNISNFLYFHS